MKATIAAHTVYNIATALDPKELQKLAAMLSKDLDTTTKQQPIKKNVASVSQLKDKILAEHKPAFYTIPSSGGKPQF